MGFLIAAIIILLILCLRISVRIRSQDDMTLWAGVGLIKIKLMPTKEKGIKLKDYEIKRFRKKHPPVDEVEEAARRAEAEKKAAEAKKAKDAKKAAAKRKKNTEIQLGQREKTNIPELIGKLTRVLKVFIARFGRHLRVKLRKLVIIIATGDAAQTAILYGASIGAVQNLYALLTSTGTLKTTRDCEIIVDTDFTSEKTVVKVDVEVSFRLWQIFDMAIRAGVEFLKKNI